MFNTCRKSYLCKKLAYEVLSSNGLFNNVYVDQECVFGKFNIGEHYRALNHRIFRTRKGNIIDYLKIKGPMRKPKYNWKSFIILELFMEIFANRIFFTHKARYILLILGILIIIIAMRELQAS